MIDYKATPQDLQALGEHSEALKHARNPMQNALGNCRPDKYQEWAAADQAKIARQQEKIQSAVLVKVCGDERLRDIVQVFESGDARRKETMWRVAVALGKHSL